MRVGVILNEGGGGNASARNSRRREGARIGMGGGGVSGREAVMGLVEEVKKEANGEDESA